MPKLLPPEAAYWKAVTALLLDRLERARAEPERGAMSAEAMIIIAALVLVAVTVMGVVTAKILAKANSIDF
ncbi:hypothetical protein HCN51_52735 [Nonomuraea sp. FMUSA5-5]|uniref:Uncharacterized protein n=1 Tax=Nonomuraea composti TaxID=2720023 RepID=A0ABX1BRX4_9ACTN|nr:hypothetical protein [Nonomuraea sp. FMUSA5-5]NJP98001.1 hypothetical protein [Nonomuraea sp. FMUSA5-5]